MSMRYPLSRPDGRQLPQRGSLFGVGVIMKNASDLFIRTFTFWPNLSEREKDMVNSGTHAIRYEKGTQVHRGPFDCIGVLLVKTGQLRVYTLSEDGRDVTLYRLFPGDVGILSASCTLDAVTFDVYIDAEEATDVLLTDASVFNRLVQKNIYVKAYAYETAANRLSEMLWKMQEILFLSADRRLALFLVEEMEKTGSKEIRLTHEQIARYMGSAREVVSRLVKYFSQEGYVQPGRGRLTVVDDDGLRALAGNPRLQFTP